MFILGQLPCLAYLFFVIHEEEKKENIDNLFIPKYMQKDFLAAERALGKITGISIEDTPGSHMQLQKLVKDAVAEAGYTPGIHMRLLDLVTYGAPIDGLAMALGGMTISEIGSVQALLSKPAKHWLAGGEKTDD